MSSEWESASPAKPNGTATDLKRTRRRNAAAPDLCQPDQLPPHDSAAEQAALGCALLDPKTIPDLLEAIKDEADFFDLRHRIIYRNIREMSDSNKAIDIITLQEWLNFNFNLDEIGGIPYLSSLQDVVPSAANLKYYLDIIREKAVLRRLLATCADISMQILNNSGNVEGLIEKVEKNVISFQNENRIVTCLNGTQSGVTLITDLERRFELGGALSGLDTGLHDLNRMTDGLQFGEQSIIGARPSMGKTALGLGMFLHNVTNGVPSLFVSLEMSVEAVMRRLLSAYMQVPLSEIKKGSYTEDQFAKFAVFKSHASKWPMHIIDGVRGVGIRELISAIRRLVLQHGIKFVVIDYLQKIKPSQKQEKRTYEIGDVSERLKAIAVECRIALVTLAQLNRENVQQKGRPPRMSDLADSGQIERDADMIGLLHKTTGEVVRHMLIVAKQRDGETGVVKLYFDGRHVRFQSLEES